MKTPVNPFKESLRTGQLQIGMRSQACSSVVAEVLGTCGYDFVYLDLEHNPAEPMSILHQLQALASTGTPAVMKLAIDDPVTLTRLLDMGAVSYVVPMVQSVEQARRSVALCKYPPTGIRAAGGLTRANRYGLYDDYVERANDEVCLIMQIESMEAIAHVEEIAAVAGVDGILFGPGDIAAGAGYLGNSTHPEVVAAISGAITRLQASGYIVGMSANEPDAEHWISQGCSFVTVATDMALLVKHARALSSKLTNLKRH